MEGFRGSPNVYYLTDRVREHGLVGGEPLLVTTDLRTQKEYDWILSKGIFDLERDHVNPPRELFVFGHLSYYRGTKLSTPPRNTYRAIKVWVANPLGLRTHWGNYVDHEQLRPAIDHSSRKPWTEDPSTTCFHPFDTMPGREGYRLVCGSDDVDKVFRDFGFSLEEALDLQRSAYNLPSPESIPVRNSS